MTFCESKWLIRTLGTMGSSRSIRQRMPSPERKPTRALGSTGPREVPLYRSEAGTPGRPSTKATNWRASFRITWF